MEPIIFVPLSQGKVAVIDFADRWVLKYNWSAVNCGKSGRELWYAQAYVPDGFNGQKNGVRMHRLIIGALPGQQCDHKSGDGLDNRRDNLRVASPSRNCQNKRKSPTAISSKFKGVTISGKIKRQARIMVGGKRLHLGTFNSDEEAARAYDEAAIRYYGQFAKTNHSMGLYGSLSGMGTVNGEHRHGHGDQGGIRQEVQAMAEAPGADRARERADGDEVREGEGADQQAQERRE